MKVVQAKPVRTLYLLPNLNVLDAVSKGMQAILLCSNKMP